MEQQKVKRVRACVFHPFVTTLYGFQGFLLLPYVSFRLFANGCSAVTFSLQPCCHWVCALVLVCPVIPFRDVYNRSLCRPRELLVEILQEYPEEVEHILIPSCVVLRRCAGCCTDEALQCTPTASYNVTMEVRIRCLRLCLCLCSILRV